MKNIVLFNILAIVFSLILSSAWADSPLPQRAIDPESAVTTEDQVTIDGQRIRYEATAGTQPVWGEEGEAVASLFYVYYRRSDVEDVGERPLVFSFNGGPGSASVWMHVGYTGPRFLRVDDEGYPVQPYGVTENEHSILDVADIVYVDPVNTGFSRKVGEDVDRDQFFGVEADVEYLAGWIENFVSRHGRWTSPKYLKGESYGTTRVAGLARELQSRHWMFVNGVILVSPTGLGLEPPAMPPRSEILKLPYYAATAWYHEALESDLQALDLYDLLPRVEEFTIDKYLPAVARGGSLDSETRDEIAAQVARYSGIDKQHVINHNLTLPVNFYWKELLRDEGLTVGRLDSRYRGIDRMDAGDRYDHDPALTAWNHAFTPAINHYLREHLGYETDLKYNIFGPVHPWNRDNDTTGEDLRRAMGENPFMQVLVQSGYYDGATDYFSAKYVMWNMDRSGKVGDRMRFEGYRSGHMMYLRQEDLATSNEHIREFIRDSMTGGEPARY
ncbi:carboxypeptidase [Wenzhouxiangella sp. AB-CW3]|uniref:S10 family peptidase n=1 Tax=Wenzhouxiangella sp. AB-CW3 TaxID=2771012 RepID=UPI00168A80AE|nr:carboxypeptidase [Wenzhouxiangella sp. AB-CW3]QOC21341.1 carboxypeptidase [Wenzhouxiangella sp. AB-CW3]